MTSIRQLEKINQTQRDLISQLGVYLRAVEKERDEYKNRSATGDDETSGDEYESARRQEKKRRKKHRQHDEEPTPSPKRITQKKKYADLPDSGDVEEIPEQVYKETRLLFDLNGGHEVELRAYPTGGEPAERGHTSRFSLCPPLIAGDGDEWEPSCDTCRTFNEERRAGTKKKVATCRFYSALNYFCCTSSKDSPEGPHPRNLKAFCRHYAERLAKKAESRLASASKSFAFVRDYLATSKSSSKTAIKTKLVSSKSSPAKGKTTIKTGAESKKALDALIEKRAEKARKRKAASAFIDDEAEEADEYEEEDEDEDDDEEVYDEEEEEQDGEVLDDMQDSSEEEDEDARAMPPPTARPKSAASARRPTVGGKQPRTSSPLLSRGPPPPDDDE